jgi:hypothetical protein
MHGTARTWRAGHRSPAVLAAVALTAAAVAAGAPTARATDPARPAPSARPPADKTLVVHADEPFRPVTHVATGSLYGLANETDPTDELAAAIKPNTFVQMPAGGTQQPTGDIAVVAPKAARVGGQLVNRLSDYYPGWPYRFSWDTWPTVVEQQVQTMKDKGIELAAWELWNESDNTWLASNGTYEDFWTRTFRQVRSLDPTTPIQGPSFSDNISDMRNFLENAVATDTVPDIIAWHELTRSSKIPGDVATVAAIMKDLGISPRPIAIEEYAAPSEVGIPGSLVGYVAKFERLGIRDAELAFWNQSGTLGDLLTRRGGSPNGAYWMYTWYAGMSGDMVTTTPPSQSGLFEGFASVTANKKELDVITGGGSGPSGVEIQGLNRLDLPATVNVRLEYTPSYGRTTPTAGPITISNTLYSVGPKGSITVPLVMNPAYAYRVVVTAPKPPATPGGLAGAFTIGNVNSGLSVDTHGSGTTPGTAVEQATAVDGDTTQSWRFADAGQGLHEIIQEASGLVLSARDGTAINGAPVVVSPDTGASNQKWQLVPDGKGNYRLLNFGTGLALAVAGMSKEPQAPVIQWTDGAVTSGCTVDGPRQPGRIGSALSFCNTASYVSLPAGSVSSLAGDYTVSAWVNPASNATWSRVFDIGTGTSASMFLTLNAGNGLRFAITTSGAGGEQRINGTGTLPLNQWSLVTVTVSGSTGTLYVDGEVVGTNAGMTIKPAAFAASTRNYVGKSQYADPPLNATVDDFNVYDRALSASEVAGLATGTEGDGNVVHYAFDEDKGTTVVDASGSGRDGVIVVANAVGTATTATDDATADHFWTLRRIVTSSEQAQ